MRESNPVPLGLELSAINALQELDLFLSLTHEASLFLMVHVYYIGRFFYKFLVGSFGRGQQTCFVDMLPHRQVEIRSAVP